MSELAVLSEGVRGPSGGVPSSERGEVLFVRGVPSTLGVSSASGANVADSTRRMKASSHA